MAIQDQQAGGAPAGTPAPLLDLFNQLSVAFEAEEALGFSVDNNQPEESFARLDAKVRELIKGYIEGGSDDWKRYVNFSPDHYVRNLVESNEDFELLVLCWEKGQVSRIHDHQKAHGWVTVLDGAVEEKRYRTVGGTVQRKDSSSTPPPALPGVITATTPCPSLEQLSTVVAKRGDGTLYINDHIALHSVGCAPGSEAPTITLHLYAPPIQRVQLFEPDTNRVVERKPGFFSVRGRRV